jgi:hypothetical protein
MNVLMKQFEFFLSLTVIVVLILIYLSSKSKTHSLLDRFVDKLNIVIGIFVAIGVILTYSVFRDNLQHTTIDNTFQIIDRGWIKINKEIIVHYKDCPNFINSLYFDWQKEKLSGKQSYNTFNNDKWYSVNYISILMFQSVEDFLTTYLADETGDYVWICNFLQWTKSPLFKKIWIVEKSNYADTTNELLDLLFKISETNDIKNAQELSTIGKQIVNSEEYKEIINKRNSSRMY